MFVNDYRNVVVRETIGANPSEESFDVGPQED